MSGELEIRGGVGGIVARLDDLDRVAHLLRSIAGHLAVLARRLAGVQARLEVRPAWVLSGALSPGTFAAAQVALVLALGGPSGLVVAGGRSEALGVALDVAVAGYRHAESGLAAGFHGTEIAMGRLIGQALLTDPGGVVGVAALGGLAVVAGRRIDLGPPWRGVGADAVRELSAHAGAVQVAVGVAPGVAGQRDLRGLASVVAGAGGLVGRLTPGGPANAAPWLRDSADVEVRVQSVPWRGLPRGLGGLAGRIPSSEVPRSVVHIERWDAGDGRPRWLVALPGTADWSPEPGRTPFDLTGDVRLMAGDPTAGATGVVRALRAVGVRPGDPVLLEGHSQGGIIAATVAADPRVRVEFTVRRVLTVGSPIASVPIPSSVSVLSVEHRDDLVPQLDGRANPATPAWVTVTAPAPPYRQRLATQSAPPLAAHALSSYQQTADRLDASPDPSLVAWRQGLARFIQPPGTGPAGGRPVVGEAWDVEITRERW